MKSTSPKVSVVMPVYNGEKYVANAVNSILNQSHEDFEFIIIDDGSTDATNKIIKSFSDNRIKLLRFYQNKGNYYARNKGMEIAKGIYICVMDSDDISIFNRIERQYKFMENNPEYGLCGGYSKVIGESKVVKFPVDYDEIKVWLLCNIMFKHPTIFIRSSFLKKFDLKYNDSYRFAADYDFLVRAAKFFPVTNLQENIIEFRKHSEQISNAHNFEQGKIVDIVCLKQLDFFEIKADKGQTIIHLKLMNRCPISMPEEFPAIQKWANFLLEKNNKTNYYHAAHLANFLKSLLKNIFTQNVISKEERSPGLSQNNKCIDFTIFDDKIQKINEILKPKISLKFEKEWAVLPDFITELINLTQEIKPLTIVECGSGLSTLICGYLAKNKMANHVFSLEHNTQFFEKTKKDIQTHDLDKFVTLINAPLKQIQIDNEQWQWYDLSCFNNFFDQIDILLVDGPPGFLQKHSRYPAFALLKKLFHKNTVVVLDDSDRHDEQEITNRWLLENPEFCASKLKTEKGMCVLKQKI